MGRHFDTKSSDNRSCKKCSRDKRNRSVVVPLNSTQDGTEKRKECPCVFRDCYHKKKGSKVPTMSFSNVSIRDHW